MVTILLCMIALGENPALKNLKIEDKYSYLVKANPGILGEPGVKLITNTKENLIVSVAYAEIKAKGSVGKLNAEKVATMKARAAVVGEKKGIAVYEKKELTESSTVIKENGTEKGKSISELTQVNEETISGAVKGCSTAARWVSDDGDVVFVAIVAEIKK